MTGDRRRVAVIGAGVAGLTAAHLLQRTHDVTLYEADDRLGGHAHTHDLSAGGGTHAVDSGFIVHNERTYPLLLRLFGELGVRTAPAEMSMSVRCDGCGLAYAGARGFAGVFAQPSNVARPRFLHLLAQIPRFHARARALLAAPETGAELTLGEFLARGRFSTYFVRHFVVPLVAAVWSCGAEAVTDYPARYLFTFLDHHGMLRIGRSAEWRTVTGGSRTYVRAVAARLSSVRIATPVRVLTRHGAGVSVRDAAGATADYAAVVVATHADQALRLLGDATPAESKVLGAFGYSHNETVLHSDATLLPPVRAARACWNHVLPACTPAAGPVQVSYDMNRLQGLRGAPPFVVTLNGADRVRADLVHARMSYRHPIYTSAVRAAQLRLPELNDGVTAFAGAYHGWGFHEDGCRAGVAAARSLGVTW